MGANGVQSAEKKSFGGRIFQRYGLDALSAMALGLFSSLIIGLILAQLGKIPGLSILTQLATVVQKGEVVGAAIGVAVAWGLKSKPLAQFSTAGVGAIAYLAGGPLGCFIASVVGAEVGNWASGRTKVDIVLIPSITIIAGGLTGLLVGPLMLSMMKSLSTFIGNTTLLAPIPMGIIVSAVVGLVLTAPISSAALCAMIFIPAEGTTLSEGLLLAAGAATAGCCAQMVGFAVISYGDNGVGGLISQGLGTSMLQVGNILRRPAILIPPTLASMITGPISTTILFMKNAGAAAGMGTSGLVGPIGTWDVMSSGEPAMSLLFKILLLHFILPAVLSLLIAWPLRKMGWIRPGDMKLVK